MPAEAIPARSASASLQRQKCEGLWLVAVETVPVVEFYLTLTPLPGESVPALARRLAEVVKSRNATVVRQLVFGSAAAEAKATSTLRETLADPNLPVTWVEGADCAGNDIAGMQIHAVAGARVRTVRSHGTVTRIWEDALATHCVVSSLLPMQLSGSRAEQAREVFGKLQVSLAPAGMAMTDLARTWFYLDDLLAWYGDFNRVRNDVFTRHELRLPRLPASTGVSGRNPAGAALVAAAWAIRPHHPEAAVVQPVPSPQQCPAPAYGSAFSRAVEIHSPGFRQLLVSGTASIGADGKTEHVGDVRAQIEHTMLVAGAILESRRLRLEDVLFATAFFKSPGDAPLFAEWLAEHQLPDLPLVCAQCDVCRDDLLFEIELTAVQAGG